MRRLVWLIVWESDPDERTPRNKLVRGIIAGLVVLGVAGAIVVRAVT